MVSWHGGVVQVVTKIEPEGWREPLSSPFETSSEEAAVFTVTSEDSTRATVSAPLLLPVSPGQPSSVQRSSSIVAQAAMMSFPATQAELHETSTCSWVKSQLPLAGGG